MAIEFERAKEVVCGRSVTITSWYDDSAKAWCASAPAYAHLNSGFPSAGPVCASRKAAVARLTGHLAAHFTGDRPAAS